MLRICFIVPMVLLALPAVYVQAAPVAITPSQLGVQSVKATGFPNEICPAGVNGCGGAFTENIGGGSSKVVLNATIWCVDSQLDVTNDESYTASIVSLNTPAASFDNKNTVRYGDVKGSTWANSLIPYGLSTSSTIDTTDALVRYRLAAILINQYAPMSNTPANNAENQSIQRAIWRLTDNTSVPGTPDLSGPININVPKGSSDWIAYAANVLTHGTFNFGQWAVVSGGFNGVTLDVPGGAGTPVQTFLVEVTPEPNFYLLLIISVAGMLTIAVGRRKKSLS